MHTFKKGKKEDPGKYRHISLTSFHRKVTEQMLLEAISKHMRKKELCTSQLGFPKVKLRLTKLIAYDEVIVSVDEERVTGICHVVKPCIWDIIAHAPVQAGAHLARKELYVKDLVDKSNRTIASEREQVAGQEK